MIYSSQISRQQNNTNVRDVTLRFQTRFLIDPFGFQSIRGSVPTQMYEGYKRKGYSKDRTAEAKAKTFKTPDPVLTPKLPGRKMI